MCQSTREIVRTRYIVMDLREPGAGRQLATGWTPVRLSADAVRECIRRDTAACPSDQILIVWLPFRNSGCHFEINPSSTQIHTRRVFKLKSPDMTVGKVSNLSESASKISY